MKTERHALLREFRPHSIRIQLHSAIGEGLTSNVYRGFREDSRGFTRQQVAVKITKCADEAGVLRREFETLLRVHSPHLVRPYAWDNHGDESMLSMEFIDGLSLGELTSSGLLNPPLVEEIITQIQKGLLALADKNLHHGDLSPNNVLVDRQGTVKLIDFANPDRDSKFTQGTAPYMAPEIWEGNLGTIASDLFSLGLLQRDLLQKTIDKGYLPPGSPSAESRCHEVAQANANHPWLARVPLTRRFVERESCSEQQSLLGQIVDGLKSEISTMPPPEPQILAEWIEKNAESGIKKGGISSLHRCFWAVSMLIILIVSCAADQNIAHLPNPVEYSKLALAKREYTNQSTENGDGYLVIHSQRWMRFQIGKKNIGYAPIALNHLKPGIYWLNWTSSAASGVKQVKIHAAQRTVLQESDFYQRISPSRISSTPTAKLASAAGSGLSSGASSNLMLPRNR